MQNIFILIGLCVLLLPHVVAAAVTITEVAWMGDTASANNEWIELHNSGATENVDGWTIDDGMNLHIELAGIIAAGQYAVLERTDDDSAEGTAFLVYTGGLVNTGTTLVLRRSDGSIADQVAGGDNWQNIGGDNITKETAQYTSGGWQTLTPTPGTENIYNSNVDADSSTTTETTIVHTAEKTKKPPAVAPDVKRVNIDMPTIAYVHQLVTFKAVPAGGTKMFRGGLEYQWNFGDLATSTGKEVVHRYSYPGTYAVQLSGAYRKDTVARTEKIIVLPIMLSVTRNSFGDIQLHNDAKYNMPIGGYTVTGNKTVTIPPDTILFPGATLTVPKSRLMVARSELVRVFDDTGTYILSQQPLGSREQKSSAAIASTQTTSPVLPVVSSATQTNSFLMGPTRSSTERAPYTEEVQKRNTESYIMYVTGAGLVLLLVVVVYARIRTVRNGYVT